jgi:chromate transporter
MAIHIGWARRRWAGLAVAGVCFIVPAMLLTGALGWAYVRFGRRPAAVGLLAGVKPVILVVILQALGRLAPKAAPTWPLRGLALAAAVASAVGVHELVVLFGAGALAAAVRAARTSGRPRGLGQLLPGLPLATGGATAAFTLPALFLVFLKIGSVLFGSGYVLLAFLRADLVERLHWISEGQLIDAVAAGQITPGPVFTTATFIGYLLAGPAGALVATAGIFLPAFAFVAVSGPLVPRLRASPLAGAFLDGVNVASLALMAVVTLTLARAAVVGPASAVIGVVAAILLFRFKVGSSWLVLGGALAGLVGHAVGLAL